MADTLARLQQGILQASGQYFRLVLLAGSPGSGKTTVLQSVAQHSGCSLLNVNLELSRRMLELTRAQRSRRIEPALREVIAAAHGGMVLLDNLEILFDASLELEPLRLLEAASRNRTIVASWNGCFKDGILTYAEPGHPEFIRFKQIEAVVVPSGGNT